MIEEETIIEPGEQAPAEDTPKPFPHFEPAGKNKIKATMSIFMAEEMFNGFNDLSTTVGMPSKVTFPAGNNLAVLRDALEPRLEAIKATRITDEAEILKLKKDEMYGITVELMAINLANISEDAAVPGRFFATCRPLYTGELAPKKGK